MARLLPQFVLFGIVLIIGCDDSFAPLSGDVVSTYSVFGFLDAEADTNWVRISPVRDSIVADDSEIEAQVTLTEIGGATEEMRPGKYYFRTVSGDTSTVWNYWTTMPIKPGYEYELRIENSKGVVTSKRVNIPEDFEAPVIENYDITFSKLDTLAELKIKWEVHDTVSNKTFQKTFSHMDDVMSRGNLGYRATIDPNNDFLICAINLGYPVASLAYEASKAGQLQLRDTQLILTAAGDDWIDVYALSKEEISVLSVQSHINNGVGFMVGVVRKVLHYPACVADSEQDNGEILICNIQPL